MVHENQPKKCTRVAKNPSPYLVRRIR